MMTYDEVSNVEMEKDMFNKMLLLHEDDLQVTIDAVEPEVKKLTIEDDIIDEDKEEINDQFNETMQLIFNLMQLDCDLFNGIKTVDLVFINNPFGAMYYIYKYILFIKQRLGIKPNVSTIIDLLINTVPNKNTGYYLYSVLDCFSNNTVYDFDLDYNYQYIKRKLDTK